MTGMDRYDEKRKRDMRRKNHILRDLMTPKYRQRIKERRRYDEYSMEEFLDDYMER